MRNPVSGGKWVFGALKSLLSDPLLEVLYLVGSTRRPFSDGNLFNYVFYIGGHGGCRTGNERQPTNDEECRQHSSQEESSENGEDVQVVPDTQRNARHGESEELV